MIKSIPAEPSVVFKPLEPTPLSPTLDKELAKEAKKLNNAEKGYQADERYLGEEQNIEQRVRQIERAADEQFWAEQRSALYGDDDIPF